MFTYEKLEKLIGIRKISDFTNPRVTKSLDLSMPINSAILWYHRDYIHNPLFQKLKRKPKVYIQMKYFKDKPGKYRKLNIDMASMVQKLKKEDDEKNFDFVTSKSKLFLTDRNIPLIFDFYHLSYIYKYNNYRSSEYDKQMNILNTLISASVEPDRATSRTIYIPIPIPKFIPKISIIKQALKFDNYKVLNLVQDKDMLLIIEIIKFIKGYTSIFDRIPNIEESDIKFIFGLNGKISMSSIQNIYALNRDNQIISKVKGVDKETALRTFIMYLINITLIAAKPLEVLEKDTSTDVSLSNDNTTDIDDIIEAHNDRYKTIEPTIEEVKQSKKSLKDIYEEDETITESASLYLQEKLDAGLITKNHYEKSLSLLQKAEKIDKENQITEDDIKLQVETLPDDIVIHDKETLKNTNDAFAKQYLLKGYKKHQERVFNHFAKIGMVMTNHDVEKKRDIAYSEDKHIITMLNNKGREIKIPIIIPAIDENGHLKLNANEMTLVKQKADLPIKKISYREVALNSYYSKVFISKANNSSSDLSITIYKQLLKRLKDGDKRVGLIILGKSMVTAVKLPLIYQVFSRKIKTLKYNSITFSFDYKSIENKFKKFDKKYGVIVATKGKTSFYINEKNELLKVDNNVENLGSFIKYLDLDIDKLKREYASMHIMGTTIPLIIILSFYDGIDEVLNRLNVVYRKTDINDRTHIAEDEYTIRFKDFKLIVKSDWYDIVVAGLLYIKDLKYYSLISLNSTEGINEILTNMNINSRRLGIELQLMKRLWVDPMTYDILKLIKEPKTFIGLLYRSAELLKDDYHNKQNNVNGLIIKTYDRLNGMLYSVLVKAIRENEQKTGMIKTKMTVNPYELKSMIAEDGTFTLVDDMNPFTKMKQTEEVTLIGKFGRDKASIAARDRVFDKSSIGYNSEATKDSGQVGVTTYLPAVSKMDNMFGLMKEQDDFTISNIVSSSAMFHTGSDTDDNKRLLYISVQNGSVVPSNSQRVWPIGTGYEYIIPYRMDKKYIAYADSDGIVLKITTKSITIQYKDKKETYKLNSWVTKEVGGLAYKHNLKTNLLKGDKVSKFDIIYYDTAFFGTDIFNDKRVVYKGGDVVLCALNETQETFEDSCTIDKEFAKRFSTNLTSVFSYSIPATSKLKEVREIGDDVKYNDTMINFVITSEFDDGELKGKLAKEFINEIDTNALRSEAKGHLFLIEVFYRCEYKDMSPSIRKFVEKIDSLTKERTGFTGKVDNTYSVKARPLEEDQIEVKFYLEKTVGMNVGDKAILANQLKMTVGELADEIRTQDGRRADLTTSDRSIGARIVNSPQDIGSASTVLILGTEEALRLAKI